MHDPVLASWCMVVTLKSMVVTTQKLGCFHFKNTVVSVSKTQLFHDCNMVEISIWKLPYMDTTKQGCPLFA